MLKNETVNEGMHRLTQENGPTLGWFEDSGIGVVERDGLYFKDLDRTGDFDKVMARFCLDAGQLSAAAAYGIGDDRRVAHLAEVCCCQCAQLLGTDMPSASKYIAGILRQMGYEVVGEGPEYWLDISWRSLFAVFKALDTYRRRLIRRHGLEPGAVMAFNVRASYRIDPVTSLVVVDTASPPPAVFKVGRPA